MNLEILLLLSNHRVEIHFALWRLRKNTIFKSHSNACTHTVYSKIKHVNMERVAKKQIYVIYIGINK